MAAKGAAGAVALTLIGTAAGPASNREPIADTWKVGAADEPTIDESNRRDVARIEDATIGLSIEIFDSVTSSYVLAPEQTCLRMSAKPPTGHTVLVDGPFEIEGCTDQAVVDAGLMFHRYGLTSGFMVGIAASGVRQVQVGGHTVGVDAQGVWYTQFEKHISAIDFVQRDGTTTHVPLG